MLGRNWISGVSEAALPFPACSRGSSGTEMKAAGKEDKQENSSGTVTLPKTTRGGWDGR